MDYSSHESNYSSSSSDVHHRLFPSPTIAFLRLKPKTFILCLWPSTAVSHWKPTIAVLHPPLSFISSLSQSETHHCCFSFRSPPLLYMPMTRFLSKAHHYYSPNHCRSSSLVPSEAQHCRSSFEAHNCPSSSDAHHRHSPSEAHHCCCCLPLSFFVEAHNIILLSDAHRCHFSVWSLLLLLSLTTVVFVRSPQLSFFIWCTPLSFSIWNYHCRSSCEVNNCRLPSHGHHCCCASNATTVVLRLKPNRCRPWS